MNQSASSTTSEALKFGTVRTFLTLLVAGSISTTGAPSGPSCPWNTEQPAQTSALDASPNGQPLPSGIAMVASDAPVAGSTRVTLVPLGSPLHNSPLAVGNPPGILVPSFPVVRSTGYKP